MAMLIFAVHVSNINIGKHCILLVRAKCILLRAYSEHFHTSKMEHFEKIVEGFELFTIFAKSSIFNVWQSSEYVSAADAYFNLVKKVIQW